MKSKPSGMTGVDGFPKHLKCDCKCNRFSVSFEESSYGNPKKFGTVVFTCLACAHRLFYEGICRHTKTTTYGRGPDGWETICADCGKLLGED